MPSVPFPHCLISSSLLMNKVISISDLHVLSLSKDSNSAACKMPSIGPQCPSSSCPPSCPPSCRPPSCPPPYSGSHHTILSGSPCPPCWMLQSLCCNGSPLHCLWSASLVPTTCIPPPRMSPSDFKSNTFPPLPPVLFSLLVAFTVTWHEDQSLRLCRLCPSFSLFVPPIPE